MNKPKLDASPVAWMYEDASGTMKMLGNTQLEEWVTKFNCKEIPLYTHPVKELTDSEIRTIQDMCHLKNVGYNNFIMRFARAILRKAQEK